MKKQLLAAAVAAAILTTTFSASEPLMGGWQPTQSAAVTPQEQTVFDQAVEGYEGGVLTPVALLSTQVVAGRNYCFLSHLTPADADSQPSYVFVYIYEDLQGNAEILEVQEIAFGFSREADDTADEPSFSPYDYITGVTGNEEFITFTFPDIRLYIPMEWDGRFIVKTDEHGVSFYQTATYDKELEERGSTQGGFLFRFSASEDEKFRELPSYRYLGYSENAGLHFYLQLPTDYRAYNDPMIRDDYGRLTKDIDLIAEKARIAPSLSFYPGESTDAGMS